MTMKTDRFPTIELNDLEAIQGGNTHIPDDIFREQDPAGWARWMWRVHGQEGPPPDPGVR